MRNYLLLLAACIALAAPLLHAAPARGADAQRWGIGPMLGEPTGVSWKSWRSDAIAFDAGLGWSLEYNSSFHMHADYLIHRYDWLMPRNLAGALPVYYGFGGRLKFEAEGDPDEPNDDSALFGARFPLGLNYLPYAGPYDVFFEVAPVLDITPQADLSFNAAIGLRVYFK